MKRHTTDPAILADEQLLFTPEEMGGLSPEPASDAEAAAKTEEAAAKTEEAAVQSKEEAAPSGENEAPTEAHQQAHQAQAEAYSPQKEAHSAHQPQQESPDEGFTDEERLVTEMTIAIEFVETLSLGEIRLIALEASVKQGTGIRPNGVYTIQCLPQYTFDGYKFLALYYVAFYRAFPTMIDKLNWPFDHLYLLARSRYDGYHTKP